MIKGKVKTRNWTVKVLRAHRGLFSPKMEKDRTKEIFRREKHKKRFYDENKNGGYSAIFFYL